MSFDNHLIYAFLLTFLAGLSTGIGGLIAFLVKRDNIKALSLGLGFSAGVMIYVSLTEILRESTLSLQEVFGKTPGEFINIAIFFVGMVIAAIIDKLVPEDMSHNIEFLSGNGDENPSGCRLCRTGLFMALVLALHNFPEGIATFVSSMANITLGISIAVAIAIHNIPEGIAVALPIYYSTKSKKKAFGAALLSGMVEPLGAVVGFWLLQTVLNSVTLGILLAAVAGIMVYISFDELLPMAREYGNGHIEIIGVSLGMLVMAVSLALL
jgi:ZIP family zinc transporter